MSWGLENQIYRFNRLANDSWEKNKRFLRIKPRWLWEWISWKRSKQVRKWKESNANTEEIKKTRELMKESAMRMCLFFWTCRGFWLWTVSSLMFLDFHFRPYIYFIFQFPPHQDLSLCHLPKNLKVFFFKRRMIKRKLLTLWKRKSLKTKTIWFCINLKFI